MGLQERFEGRRAEVEDPAIASTYIGCKSHALECKRKDKKLEETEKVKCCLEDE